MTENPIMTKRLTIRAPLNSYGGHGIMTINAFEQLSKAGVFCAIRAMGVDEQWGRTSAIPIKMRAQIVTPPQPEEWELVISDPRCEPTPRKKTATWTMFESTELPKPFISTLNRSQVVIVPCAWNEEHFKSNGVKQPIRRVPLGFDPEVFKPSPVLEHGPCIFGVAGRTRHCARRKAVQEAINLFCRTFPLSSPDSAGVRLHVKAHPDDFIDEPKDDYRIKVIRSNFEPYEIAQWISGLTAYVTLSRAEGWGLWPLQALACGRPVIGCSYSGQADFMTQENSFIIPHREVDAVSGESNIQYLGRWAQPDEEIAGRVMMSIFKNRKKAIEKGLVGAASVAHLTWEESIKKLISVLEEFGAL